MNDNTFIASLMVFAILGLFFVSQGITGMVVMDQFTAPICESSNDCAAPTTCCPFYQETRGACAQEDMCGQIYALRGGEIPGEGIQTDNTASIISFVAGVIIIVISGFMLVAFNRQHTTKKHHA